MVALTGLQLFQNMTRDSQAEHRDHYVKTSADVDVHGIVTKVTSEVLSNVHADGDEEVMIEERFSVDKGDNLVIDVAHADVEIRTGSSSTAEIVVTLEGRRWSRAQEKFEDMNWRVYQDGDAVYVEAESPRGNWNVSMDIDVLISIPAEFNLDLETSHGDIELDELMGEVDIVTSHGDVEFAELQGETISIRSSHGDISGYAIDASLAEIQTSHADINVEIVEAEEFDARTSHADVEIQQLMAESFIETSHGDIEVYLAGDHSARLETQHGDIELDLDRNEGAELDLEAADVEVDGSFNLNGRAAKKYVEGEYGGGGRLIKGRTTHGSIEVHGR